MKIKIGGTYKHYKNNNFYKVVAIAKDSENLQDVVVYEALYPNPLSHVWTRPYHEWIEGVKNEKGDSVQRFSLVI
jgi:hypothetical protein